MKTNEQLSVWYFILTTIGICGYAVVLTVMIVDHKKFLEHPFYIFIWHLAVGDLALLVQHYVVAIPLTITATAVYGQGLLASVLVGADTVFFYQIHALNLVISLNRFCVFMAPTTYQRIFLKRSRMHALCFLTWVIGFAWVVVYMLIGCEKRFNHQLGFYYRACSRNQTNFEQGVVRIHQAYTVLCPVISFLIYILLYIRVKARAQRVSAVSMRANPNSIQQAATRERSLLVQGSLICGVLLLEIGLFQTSDLVVSFACSIGRCALATALISGMVIVNSAINPFIYLTFNSLIRHSVWKRIKWISVQNLINRSTNYGARRVTQVQGDQGRHTITA